MNTGIYEIVNSINGNRYIGSAVNFISRWKGHKRCLLQNRHHSHHLQRAWNKYGEGAFSFNKILICSRENLLMYEQKAIDALEPAYNICKFAGNTLGVVPTLEKRAKISKSLTGKTHSAESRAKMSATRLGKPLNISEQGRLNILDGIKKRNNDYLRSPELRARASKRLKGKAFRTGIPHTEETKQKLRIARVGKQPALGLRHSAATKAKMSLARKNVRLSLEHAAKISAALKGVEKSIEHKKKLRKFSDEQAVSIRSRYAAGEKAKDLAMEFNCSGAPITNIIHCRGGY